MLGQVSPALAVNCGSPWVRSVKAWSSPLGAFSSCLLLHVVRKPQGHRSAVLLRLAVCPWYTDLLEGQCHSTVVRVAVP